MMKNTILLVGNFMFPDGNAAGKRVLGLGYILKDLGYTVVFTGCAHDRKEIKIKDTKDRFEEFEYFNFYGNRSTRDITNVKRAFGEFIDVVDEIGMENLFAVIIYGSPVLATWVGKIVKFCKKNHIVSVFDCVDWIEKSGFEGKFKNCIKYIDTNLMKRYYACKCDGIIVISQYLYEYYTRKKKITAIIPPVGKVNKACNCSNSNDSIKLVYAGSMPKEKNVNKSSLKDRIDITVELIYRLGKRGRGVILDIYGIEEEQYLQAIPEHKKIIEELGDMISFHGRTGNRVVCEAIKMADFTILNRVVTKVTTAGFPTKVSESLLMGTPVITNDTSDMRDYIKDYKNGLIIDFDLDCAEKQIAALLDDIMTIKQMKKNCTNECVFEYGKYIDIFYQFMGEVLNQ